MLGVSMQNVIVLIVIMLDVIMQNIIMPIDFMLNPWCHCALRQKLGIIIQNVVWIYVIMLCHRLAIII